MRLSALLLACAALTTGAWAYESPAPGSVYIKALRHSGNGCPVGSVAHNLAPDGKAFTLLFDQFIVDGSNAGQASKSCRVDIDMVVPAGLTYALYCLDYRGYASLEDTAQAQQSTTYQFGSQQPVSIGNLRLKGPYSDDYYYQLVTPHERLAWADCSGTTRTVRLDTTIVVKGNGFMTLDSADGELKHHYGIYYKKCTPPPPPPPPPKPKHQVLSLSMPGNGFDGDLDLCLNPKTGLLTTNQVGGDKWRGIVNLQFTVNTTDGPLPATHVSQTPSTFQLPGNWAGVKDANPVVTSWSRLSSGNPPQIQAFQSGVNRCLRLIDGCCGRPGAVKMAVEWNLVR